MSPLFPPQHLWLKSYSTQENHWFTGDHKLAQLMLKINIVEMF